MKTIRISDLQRVTDLNERNDKSTKIICWWCAAPVSTSSHSILWSLTSIFRQSWSGCWQIRKNKIFHTKYSWVCPLTYLDLDPPFRAVQDYSWSRSQLSVFKVLLWIMVKNVTNLSDALLSGRISIFYWIIQSCVLSWARTVSVSDRR